MRLVITRQLKFTFINELLFFFLPHALLIIYKLCWKFTTESINATMKSRCVLLVLLCADTIISYGCVFEHGRELMKSLLIFLVEILRKARIKNISYCCFAFNFLS